MITGGLDRALRRWDVATGALLAERAAVGADSWAAPLAVTADHSTVFVWDGGTTIRPLDAVTLEARAQDVVDVGAPVDAAAVSPDGGSLVVSTFNPATLLIIDLETGGTRRLAVPADVFALAFSPDGSLLIAGDGDGRVLRIDPVTATLVSEPVVGHDGRIIDLSFAADGSRFTSGSYDGTIVMWDAATGRAVGTVQPGPPNARVRSVWASDGYTLVVMYADRSVYTFDTRPSSWLEHACDTASRQLTEREWLELLPSRPYEPACG